MQNTKLAIPKSITKGEELVIITRREYEELKTPEGLEKKSEVKEFEPTKNQKVALRQARLNRANGDFLTFDELKKKLGLTN
jgi:hypothetical protein